MLLPGDEDQSPLVMVFGHLLILARIEGDEMPAKLKNRYRKMIEAELEANDGYGLEEQLRDLSKEGLAHEISQLLIVVDRKIQDYKIRERRKTRAFSSDEGWLGNK